MAARWPPFFSVMYGNYVPFSDVARFGKLSFRKV
jgi:hypothetical protein